MRWVPDYIYVFTEERDWESGGARVWTCGMSEYIIIYIRIHTRVPCTIARSDYVFTTSEQNGRAENSLGSAVPRMVVRLFELCMDTACLQRVLFAVPARANLILEIFLVWRYIPSLYTSIYSIHIYIFFSFSTLFSCFYLLTYIQYMYVFNIFFIFLPAIYTLNCAANISHANSLLYAQDVNDVSDYSST